MYDDVIHCLLNDDIIQCLLYNDVIHCLLYNDVIHFLWPFENHCKMKWLPSINKAFIIYYLLLYDDA